MAARLARRRAALAGAVPSAWPQGRRADGWGRPGGFGTLASDLEAGGSVSSPPLSLRQIWVGSVSGRPICGWGLSAHGFRPPVEPGESPGWLVQPDDGDAYGRRGPPWRRRGGLHHQVASRVKTLGPPGRAAAAPRCRELLEAVALGRGAPCVWRVGRVLLGGVWCGAGSWPPRKFLGLFLQASFLVVPWRGAHGGDACRRSGAHEPGRGDRVPLRKQS